MVVGEAWITSVRVPPAPLEMVTVPAAGSTDLTRPPVPRFCQSSRSRSCFCAMSAPLIATSMVAASDIAIRARRTAGHHPIPRLQIGQAERAGTGQGLLSWFYPQQAGVLLHGHLHGGPGVVLDRDRVAAERLHSSQEGDWLSSGSRCILCRWQRAAIGPLPRQRIKRETPVRTLVDSIFPSYWGAVTPPIGTRAGHCRVVFGWLVFTRICLQPWLRCRDERQLILILQFTLNVGEKRRERHRVAKALQVDLASGIAGNLGKVVLPAIRHQRTPVQAPGTAIVDGIDDDSGFLRVTGGRAAHKDFPGRSVAPE